MLILLFIVGAPIFLAGLWTFFRKRNKPPTGKIHWLLEICVFIAKCAVILCLLVVGLVCFALVDAYLETRRPTHYDQGSEFRVEKLPPSARDINKVRSFPFDPMGLCYEFTCTEDDFRIWAEEKRKKFPELSEIREEPGGTTLTVKRDGTFELIKIKDCLISDWTFEDEGFHLIYDKTSGRAFRWSHSR